MKIVMTGGSGFIGSHLVSFLEQQGHEILVLSRNAKQPHMMEWYPEEGKVNMQLLEGVDIVINLAGETIFGRWTETKKEKIRGSRVSTTRFLCSALLSLKVPPWLYIGASAMGYYGDRNEEVLTEASGPGDDFMSEVCVEWEKAAEPLTEKKMRTIFARFGIVLGRGGGVLKYMEKAFRLGMGGYLGTGKQMMSWIAIEDLCAAIQHCIQHKEISGPINFAAPQAVTNQEFSQTMGKLLNRPAVFPVPKFALSMLFGEGAEMFLASTRISPTRLLESGFQFQYPLLEQALKKYVLSADLKS